MAVDFGLLRVPDFAEAATSGYAAGQRIGQQKRLDAALTGFDFARPETAMAVLRADPQLGSALLGASQKMAAAEREAAGREALSGFLMNRLGKSKGGDPSISAPASPVTGATPPAEGDDIVVNAPQRQPDYEAEMIRRDPEGYLAVQGNLAKMDDAARERIAAAAEAQGTIALAASKLPYEQRAAYIESQLPYLEAHGVSRQEVMAFDPTDANIQSQANQALGVKGILSQMDREADNERQNRALAGTERSRALRDSLAIKSDRRAAEARSEGRVRFKERDKDRAALAASGGGSIPTNTDDLDY